MSTPQSSVFEIPRTIDNTVLEAYMSCEYKYWAAYVRNKRLKSDSVRPALVYGTTWHAILDTHYRTGGDASAVAQAALDSWKDHGHEDDHRTLARSILEYGKYIDRWGTIEQEDAETVGYPDTPIVEVATNALWPDISHPYAGKLDRIIKLAGHYYIEDHKTTSRYDKYYFRQWELSNQMMGYAKLGALLLNVPIEGVRINLHVVRKNDSQFERQIVTFSKDRLEDWSANHELNIERLRESYRTDTWRRNFNACSSKWGMCQFASVCSMPPRVREAVLEQDYDTYVWDPLAVHTDPQEGEE